MTRRVKNEIKEATKKAFSGYNLSDIDAPQGSNNFSSNVLIEDETGTYLVKVIQLNKLSPGTLEDTFNSIKAAKEAVSPFFVPLIEVKKTTDFVFLRFPFLSGETLTEYKNNKTFSEKELKTIAISLLRGVADYSRFEIVHQDIKPDNIFVTNLGEIKILDFGSSRYKKSSFRGATRTNRHYASPEQIYASRPLNLELLRLTSDERSDVYSVGVVLYELCTKELPFADNDAKLKEKIPPKITRTDISDDFKQILFRLLNQHPRNRPSATEASSFFEKGKVSQISFPRGGLYYYLSTSTAYFQEALDLDESLFQGVVVRASRLPQTAALYLSSGPLVTIIDPETYLFQAPVHINKKFKELPYYKYGVSPNGSISLANITSAKIPNLIKDTLRYEISAGSDILIPPYFLIKETQDISWTLDQEVAVNVPQIYKKEAMQLPLFKGVALSYNVLTTKATMGKVLDYLTSPALNNYSGYYVVLENNSSDEALTSGAWLSAARIFIIRLLATGKTVIWGQSPLASIVFSGQPGLSIALGEGVTQRNFIYQNKNLEVGQVHHIFMPQKYSRGLNGLSSVKSEIQVSIMK